MGATNSMTQYATPDATAALAEAQHRAELAEQRLSDMKAMLADMTAQRDDVKADRNRWRTQAEATQRLLSDATARGAALVAKARRVKNEDRLSLAQMERLRAELRPNLVFVLELVRRELHELRVETMS